MCEGVVAVVGGDSTWLVDLPHLTGFSEEKRDEAELKRDRRPAGVLLLLLPPPPDFPPPAAAFVDPLALGPAVADVFAGVEVAGGRDAAKLGEPAEPMEARRSSLEAALFFLEDFLWLAFLLRFNMSGNRIGVPLCGVESGDSLLDSSLLLFLRCSGRILAKLDPAIVQDRPGCGGGVAEPCDHERLYSDISVPRE